MRFVAYAKTEASMQICCDDNGQLVCSNRAEPSGNEMWVAEYVRPSAHESFTVGMAVRRTSIKGKYIALNYSGFIIPAWQEQCVEYTGDWESAPIVLVDVITEALRDPAKLDQLRLYVIDTGKYYRRLYANHAAQNTV